MALAASALILALVGGAGSGEVALLGIGAGLLLDLGLKQARLLRRRREPSPPVAVNPVVLLALGGVVRMVYRLATGT